MTQSGKGNLVSDLIQEIRASSRNDISSTNQTNVGVSSITNISSNTSSRTVITESNSCQYKFLSSDVSDCRNLGTYKCPHCSISFCLQHGLQHQTNLKGEIQELLTKTQELADNIQKLNLIDVKSSCMAQIDQWALTMHSRIDEIHNELQISVDQFDQKIKEKSDHLKTFLESHLEQDVDRVLKEQLEKFEIDQPQIEEANMVFTHLGQLLHSFNNQQLIRMTIDLENQVILNPPVIIFSDDIVDELNFENSQEQMDDAADQQKDNMPDNPISDSLSSGEVIDDLNGIIQPTETEADMATTNNDERPNETIENIVTTNPDLSENIFNENTDPDFMNLLSKQNAAFTMHHVRKVVELARLSLESQVSLPFNFNFSLENVPISKRGGSKLDLRTQGLTDKDIPVVIEYALSNSQLIEPFKILDISVNKIGSVGTRDLCTALLNNTTLTTLYLRENKIENNGADYLSIILEKNTTLTDLDISRNNIGQEGIFHLSNALKINKTLTILNLDHNPIGSQPVEYLCDALQENNTLKVLKLNWCHIDACGAQFITKTLKTNTSINVLELACNKIGLTGALHFVDVLRYNTTLTTLNLRSNQIKHTGAFHLSGGLQTNTTLIHLNLEQNLIEDIGTKHLCKALKYNTTLRTLNLSNNSIKHIGAAEISHLLTTNTTLTNLDLSYNAITSTGARYLGIALIKNKTLTELNLQHNGIRNLGILYLLDAIEKNKTVITLNLKGNSILAKDEMHLTNRLMENKRANEDFNDE